MEKSRRRVYLFYFQNKPVMPPPFQNLFAKFIKKNYQIRNNPCKAYEYRGLRNVFNNVKKKKKMLLISGITVNI